MTVVTYENDPIALCGKFSYFTVNLFDQWASGINDEFEPLVSCLLPNSR
jgi:hypothetical protein